MPHIRFRGTSSKTVALVSARVQELADIVKTNVENFTFEDVQSQFYENGKPTDGTPLVEVLWFPRSQDVKDETAKFLTNTIRQLENSAYITVIFIVLEANSYFENGKHF